MDDQRGFGSNEKAVGCGFNDTPATSFALPASSPWTSAHLASALASLASKSFRLTCSPARRTRQTWHGIAIGLTREDAPEVRYEPAIYTGDVDDVLSLVQAVPDGFGTVPEELADVLFWHAGFETAYRGFGATIIDATMPLPDVVAEVLAAVTCGR